MNLITRLICFGLLAALCSLQVQAAAAPAPKLDDSARKLDGIIESLKKEAVDFNREAQDIEEMVLYPDHTRTSVYISNNVSQLLLQSVSVSIDEGKPVRYDYSERTAKALLLSDGLQRIMLANVEPGQHTIRAEFRGRFADEDAGEIVTGRYEQTFDKKSRPMELELEIARYTRLSKPKMALIVWKSTNEADDSKPAAAKKKQSSSQKRRTPTP